MRAPAGSVDEVFDLYERWGSDPYDEAVSQRDHALQTAALALAEGAAGELVAAALLHDVGHLLELADRNDSRQPADPGSDPDPGSDHSHDHGHEATGAAWLTGLFPATVTDPIAVHVRAKRYLCATDPGYLESLSAGSTRSLQRQGGPLIREESIMFEADPGFLAAVRLRRWDDRGKAEGMQLPPLDRYRSIVEAAATGVSPNRGRDS